MGLNRTLWVIVFLFFAGIGFSQTHVGVVVEMYPGEIKGVRDGKEFSLEKGIKLYPNDVISRKKEVELPKVMWWPYAGWKNPQEESVEVSFTSPQANDKKGSLDKLKGFMGFVETEYASVDGVADQDYEMNRDIIPEKKDREVESQNQSFDEGNSSSKEQSIPPGSAMPQSGVQDFNGPGPSQQKLEVAPCADKPSLEGSKASPVPAKLPAKKKGNPFKGKGTPQPGYDVTVVPREPIRFTWNKEAGEAKAVVFSDKNGKEVFRKAVSDYFDLKAEEIGIKPGETYSWKIEGLESGISPVIRLLSSENINQIKNDFKVIDGESKNEEEKRLRKIAYLQFMSDMYPEEIDLYWLSFQYLEKMETLSKKNPGLSIQKYKNKFFEHMKKTAPDRNG